MDREKDFDMIARVYWEFVGRVYPILIVESKYVNHKLVDFHYLSFPFSSEKVILTPENYRIMKKTLKRLKGEE